MEKAKFEEITKRLRDIYRNGGKDGLSAERDRINGQLAPDLLRIEVRDLPHGSPRMALLYNLGTRPPQELYRTVPIYFAITPSISIG
jgi:hypothetical protein